MLLGSYKNYKQTMPMLFLTDKNKLSVIIKILMTIALLVCLLDMPYGYYQLVRFSAMVVFGVFAVSYYINEKSTWMYFYGFSALLFNPFLKVYLGRTMWNVVDVVVAIIIIVNIITEQRKSQIENDGNNS